MSTFGAYLGLSCLAFAVLPLGHAAFGVICYVTLSFLYSWRLASTKALVVVLGATQLPDLIDKPAVFYGLVSSGRSAGHSILVAALICGGVAMSVHWLRTHNDWVSQQLSWVHPVPFTVGYLSHLLGDSYQALLAARWQAVSYLGWPFVRPPQYPSDSIAPWIRLQRIYLGGEIHPQWMLILLAVALYTIAVGLSQRESR